MTREATMPLSRVLRWLCLGLAVCSSLLAQVGCSVQRARIEANRFSFDAPVGFDGPIEVALADDVVGLYFVRSSGSLKSRIEVAQWWVKPLNTSEQQLRREALDCSLSSHEGRLRGREQVWRSDPELFVVNGAHGSKYSHSFMRDGTRRVEWNVCLRYPEFVLMLVLQEPADFDESGLHEFQHVVDSVRYR